MSEWDEGSPEAPLPRYAPKGFKWVCTACGKEQPYDLYKFRDEACVLNAVLVEEP